MLIRGEEDHDMSVVRQAQMAPVEEIDYLELDKTIDEEFANDKENLIMMLQAIQRRYNYLPKPSLTYLSEKVGVPLSHIYGIATFYASFSLEPRGRNLISICLGTACHVRGADRVHQRIEEHLHLHDGETSKDRRFTLESVRCIGCCSLGPVVKVNEDVHARTSPDGIKQILDGYE
jgi:NADH:ubiquinone oxidoreductase subunit E